MPLPLLPLPAGLLLMLEALAGGYGLCGGGIDGGMGGGIGGRRRDCGGEGNINVVVIVAPPVAPTIAVVVFERLWLLGPRS